MPTMLFARAHTPGSSGALRPHNQMNCRLVQNVPRSPGPAARKEKAEWLFGPKAADPVALAQRGTAGTILAPQENSIDAETTLRPQRTSRSA